MTDQKTGDFAKGAPNTEALSPEKLREVTPLTARQPPEPPTVKQALVTLAAAQAEHDEATREESRARQAQVAAQTRVGRAEQLVTAAHRGYDLALRQARRAGIDPTERRDGV